MNGNEALDAAEHRVRLADQMLADAAEAATTDMAMFRLGVAQVYATQAVAIATMATAVKQR